MLKISANQPTIQVYGAQCMLDILICRHFFRFYFQYVFYKRNLAIHTWMLVVYLKQKKNIIWSFWSSLNQKLDHFYFYFYSASFQPNSPMEFHVIFIIKTKFAPLLSEEFTKAPICHACSTIFFPCSMQIVHLANLNMTWSISNYNLIFMKQNFTVSDLLLWMRRFIHRIESALLYAPLGLISTKKQLAPLKFIASFFSFSFTLIPFCFFFFVISFLPLLNSIIVNWLDVCVMWCCRRR